MSRSRIVKFIIRAVFAVRRCDQGRRWWGNFKIRNLHSDLSLPEWVAHAINRSLKINLNLSKKYFRHIKQKHDPESFPLGCRFCLQRFADEADCRQHEDAIHDNETPTILFCDICNVSGDKKEGMRRHIEDDHLKLTQMRRSRKRKATDIHSERPTIMPEDKVKCEKCDERYTENKLRYHVMMVHDKAYRLLEPHEVQHEMKCCACHQEFSSEEALLNHLEVHRADYNNSPCNHCPIPPKTFDHFLAHCKHHLKPKTHICLQCNKLFPFDGKLIAHITGHKRMENYRNISCKKCEGKFRSIKDLEVHDKIKHHNLTLFVCPHCAKSMSTSGALDNHIRFVHNKEKGWSCCCFELHFPITLPPFREDAWMQDLQQEIHQQVQVVQPRDNSLDWEATRVRAMWGSLQNIGRSCSSHETAQWNLEEKVQLQSVQPQVYINEPTANPSFDAHWRGLHIKSVIIEENLLILSFRNLTAASFVTMLTRRREISSSTCRRFMWATQFIDVKKKDATKDFLEWLSWGNTCAYIDRYSRVHRTIRCSFNCDLCRFVCK